MIMEDKKTAHTGAVFFVSRYKHQSEQLGFARYLILINRS